MPRRASSAANSKFRRSSSSSSRSGRLLRSVPNRRITHSRRAAIELLQLAGLAQERVDDGRHAIPLGFFGRELAPPSGGDLVKPCLSVVVSNAPLSPHKPALLQAHQPRVEGATIQTESANGDLLQARGDRVAVQRPKGSHRLQGHEVEGALQYVGLSGLSIRHPNELYIIPLARQMELRF